MSDLVHKMSKFYQQICTGSLVSAAVAMVSALHLGAGLQIKANPPFMFLHFSYFHKALIHEPARTNVGVAFARVVFTISPSYTVCSGWNREELLVKTSRVIITSC